MAATGSSNLQSEPKYDTIRSPSVAGVDAAGLPSVLWKFSSCAAGAWARYASLPSARR